MRLAHALEESESMHFVHARRHVFAWPVQSVPFKFVYDKTFHLSFYSVTTLSLFTALIMKSKH